MATSDDVVLDVDGLRMRYGTKDVLHDVTFQARRGRGAGPARAERRRQDHHDRDPGGLPDALGRPGRACSASTRPAATSGGAPGSGSSCSPGATTASGGCGSCWPTSARTTPATRRRPIRRPWDAGRTDRGGRPDRARATSRSGRSPAGSGAGWTWRSASSAGPSCCSSTSPRPASTRRRGGSSTTSCGGWPTRATTTILLTTHDLDEAEKLADRILILNGGRIIADGTADELAQRIAGQDEVRWTLRRAAVRAADRPSRPRSCSSCSASTARTIADLEVRRSSLEDTYLALVARPSGPERPDELTPRHGAGRDAGLIELRQSFTGGGR